MQQILPNDECCTIVWMQQMLDPFGWNHLEIGFNHFAECRRVEIILHNGFNRMSFYIMQNAAESFGIAQFCKMILHYRAECILLDNAFQVEWLKSFSRMVETILNRPSIKFGMNHSQNSAWTIQLKNLQNSTIQHCQKPYNAFKFLTHSSQNIGNNSRSLHKFLNIYTKDSNTLDRL